MDIAKIRAAKRDTLARFFKYTKLEGTDIIDRLDALGFFTQAASVKHHGNFPGGLFEHSYAVMTKLCSMSVTERLNWQRWESPLIVGIMHDLCKCDLYVRLDEPDEKGRLYVYNEKADFDRHGAKSVEIAKSIIDLTEEEEACIRCHMGAFTKAEEWKDYTEAVEKFPTVLWTHTADMLASHVLKI